VGVVLPQKGVTYLIIFHLILINIISGLVADNYVEIRLYVTPKRGLHISTFVWLVLITIVSRQIAENFVEIRSH